MIFADRSFFEEEHLHFFSTEASTLHWPPGEWPEQVQTNLGNSQPLIRQSLDKHGATYTQLAGCITVRIYND